MHHSIFIFTNNDSTKLGKVLAELSSVNEFYNIYVIDDSHSMGEIENNIRLTSKLGKNSYLGKEAFTYFYEHNDIEGKPSGDFIGTENWNLGTARNFALDYSIVNNYEKILFIDDDISDIKINNVRYGFSTLTNNNFVSCHLKGRPDNSIVGHLAEILCEVDSDKRMLSGGFLFLSPRSLNHRFYNIYNEDWILQLLEADKQRIMLPFSVNHDINGETLFKEDALYFQEIGEIVVKGLLVEKTALTLKSDFWTYIIQSRILFIQTLIEKSEYLKKTKETIILSSLYEWLKHFTGETLLKLILRN